MKYIIYGSVDNGSANCEILYSSDSLEELKAFHTKLNRLCDLQYPETPALIKEFSELYKELEKEGFSLDGEDIVNIREMEWSIDGVAEVKEVSL